MNKYLLLHVGFEKPSPEMMNQWKDWFASIADVQVDMVGFAAGREITREGTRDLPWDLECLTGYNVIQAESLEAAEQIAGRCPFVSSIRVYELRSH